MGATASGIVARPVPPATPHRLRDRPWLLVAAIGAPVAELLVLWAVGLSADRALAVEVSAPSPIGEFHDLRWLMILQNSWFTLGLQVLGLLLARSLLNAVIVHQAWCDGSRPPFLVLWRGTAVASFVLEVCIAPWAALAFGVGIVSISWLWFAALPPIVVVALASPHGPVSRGWWHQVPPRRAVGWIALVVAETTLAGAVVRALPAELWVPAVAAAGWFNAWAWRGVVGAVAGRVPVRRRFLPVAPAAALGMVAVAVVGTEVSFAAAAHPVPVLPAPHAVRPPTRGQAVAASGAPVVVVSGFDTSWDGRSGPAIPGPFDEERFSYRGLGPTGQPLGYPAAATHQSLRTSVRLLAAQVGRLHRATGRPVTVVAESEGELVGRVYAAAYPSAPLARLILLSPLEQPGREYYPRNGQEGYGWLTGYELRGLTALLDRISPVNLPADSPFLRSIVDHADALRNLLSCPAGSTPEQLIEPLADAVADPASPPPSIPTLVLPAFHGGLLSDPAAQADVVRLLKGGHPADTEPGLTGLESVLRLGSAPWQVPALPLSLYPSAGSDDPSCASMDHAIQTWIGTVG